MLAGLNEAIDGSNNSYMVQLNSYASQINAITGVPEPSSMGMGLLAFGSLLSLRRVRRRPCPRIAESVYERLRRPRQPRRGAFQAPWAVENRPSQ
jgi:hypothetical protein